jgi:DNA processing protein
MSGLVIEGESYGLIELGDDYYPELLAQIASPPQQLYYMGDLALLSRPCVAVVGARRATEYGKWAAMKLAKRLSDHGVVVVSGMAEGIDAFAHQGALEGKTPTVAVMGAGIDVCYPRIHRKLREEIAQSGLILSELAPGVHPTRYTFPLRNRIISGLSVATVVAEAGLASGSLITAELAATQGREVYAVPGNINRKMSIGCNKLIRDGARPLAFLDDVLSDLGIHTDIEALIAEVLGGDERLVYEAVCARGELTVDEAAFAVKKSVSLVAAVVTVLEMKGLLAFDRGKIIPLK